MITSIRALTPTDASDYAAIRRESLIESPLAFGSSIEDDVAVDASAVRGSLGPEWVIFGAFGPTLVGTVGLIRERKRKSAHRAVIWGTYVRRPYRGQGIGAQLMRASLERARSWPGVSWLTLSVSTTAPAAKALYERLGFTVWGTEPAAVRYEHHTVDVDHMILELR
ncbi:MAG: GNAT family N-acetyltransferase [Pseudomonadota bacterium]